MGFLDQLFGQQGGGIFGGAFDPALSVGPNLPKPDAFNPNLMAFLQNPSPQAQGAQGVPTLPPATTVGAPQFAPPVMQMSQQAPVTDVSAQSRPQPVAAAPQALPTMEPGFGDRASAAFQGLTHSPTLIGGIGNMVQGLMTGQRSDARGVQQQQQLATYKALVGSGVPGPLAQAATLNPEILKTIAPAYFDTAPKLTETGTDPFTGQKTFAEYRAGRGLTPIGGAGASAGTPPSTGAFGEAVKNGVTGEELYKHLPAPTAATVRAMIEGRMAPPSTVAMRSPQTMALINAANAIDPTFDAATWGQRAAAAKDFGSGKSSEMVRAANQTMHHVGKLIDSMDALSNGSYPMLNYVGNAINVQRGKGEVGAFETNAHAVAEEMSKVFKGNNMSDAEIRAWEHNLSPNMSPEQQRAQVGKLMELLHGSLSALEEKRLNGMGPMASEKAGPLLKPEAAAVLKRAEEWARANGQHTAAPAKTEPVAPLGVGQSTNINGVTIRRVN